MAGYSGTPLARKLGIKPGLRVAFLGAPDGFTVDDLPAGVRVGRDLRGAQPVDVMILFAESSAGLPDRFARAAARLTQSGGLWVAWPKGSSGRQTDLNENGVRAIGLAAGLVDNKICAIDEVWSGLRFVRRLKDRA